MSTLRRRARFSLVLAAAFAAGALSCTEVSGPTELRRTTAAPNALLGDLVGNVLNSLHILQCQPQAYDSVTQVINGGGGTINVGMHKFVVPPGALSGPTEITAVAPHVNRREVRFSPEGLQFKKPASLTLSYANCSLASQLLPKKIVYTSDGLDPLELIQSLDNILSKKVTGPIEHFSSYVLWQ